MTNTDDECDPFTVLSSKTAYKSPWIEVEHQEVLLPDGSPGTYGIVHFANRAVGVLPVEDNGDAWLVGQFRRPLNAWSWEMPEGGVPFHEDLEAGARRELEEEAGLIAGAMIKILEMDLSNSVSDEVAYCYLAYSLTEGVKAPEPSEVLKLRRIPFAQLLQEVTDGRIRDSLTVATVLRTYHLAHTGQLPDSLAAAMLGSRAGD